MLRQRQGGCLLLLVAWLSMTGCGPRPVTMHPPVSTSLGYAVFKELGVIHRAPIHIGLLIDAQLRELMFRHSGKIGVIEIPLGQILAAKLIQVVSYRFDHITLAESPSNTPPILLHIGLQGGAPSLNIDVDKSTGFSGISTFDIIAKIDLNLRATLTDQGQVIWVGAPRFVEELKSGGAMYAVSDANTQASDITNRITDSLVAQFAQQMRRSDSLNKYLEVPHP